MQVLSPFHPPLCFATTFILLAEMTLPPTRLSSYPSIPNPIRSMLFSVAAAVGITFHGGRERGGELESEKRRSRKEP